MSKVITHLRAQWAGFLALFLVIAGGTAYAANTIGSSDIINGQVMSPDIGNNQVKSIDVRDDGQPEGGLGSVDIANNSLTSEDVMNNTVAGEDVGDGSLSGLDILDNSLGGSDVYEPDLAEVPSARIGGLGRWTGGRSCDPESENYVDCVIVTLNLPAPARVLLIGQGSAVTEPDANSMGGDCELVSEVGRIVPNSRIEIFAFDFSVGAKNFGLTAVTGVFPAGSHDFAVDCNQEAEFGAIEYFDMGISAVAISPD
jgi:hypothetical protein